jgi:hypothetical protein
MDILSAIKREERKLEKQVATIQHKLKGIKEAAWLWAGLPTRK